jgi:rhodanese-related sulfurtransferase
MNNYQAQKAYISVLVTALLLMPACGWWKTQQPQEQQATVSDVETGTQDTIRQDVKLIYIPTDAEQFKDAHIPGSIAMDLEDIQEKTKDWPKDTRIVTYCANYFCPSSKQAFDILKKLGFTNVKVYKAGISEWYQKSQVDSGRYPVVGKAAAPWLKNTVEKPEGLDTQTTISSEELSDIVKKG